jgi:hypothetical protein
MTELVNPTNGATAIVTQLFGASATPVQLKAGERYWLAGRIDGEIRLTAFARESPAQGVEVVEVGE